MGSGSFSASAEHDSPPSPWSGPLAPRLTGRFHEQGGALHFAWSGSAVTVRFHGTGLAVDLQDAGQNRFAVLVDGQLRLDRVVPGRRRRTLPLVAGLPKGEHTLTLYRLTEALVGETVLHGFHLPEGGTFLPAPPAARRRIEVIGDSISAGYGNEGPSELCSFSPSTENHYETYGAIAARALDADLVTIAWSGKGVMSNRGDATDAVLLPELWRRTLPTREDSPWPFAAPPPQVVVINLGTNDFAPAVADTSPFAAAYARFVAEVRERYPEAMLLCAVGPLLRDPEPAERAPNGGALSAVRQALSATVVARRRAGDERVEVLEFEAVRESEGWGCDYHPSVASHRRMAGTLAARIRELVRWD